MQPRKYLLIGGALLLLAASFLLSCYPGDNLSASDTDMVVTLFDKKADFSTKLTYAMPDSVLHLVKEGEEDKIDRKYDQVMLDRVVANMNALGYTREADPANADVFVVTAVTVQDYLGYAWYGWSWGYWYPYPPGWGWYPWYPNGTYYTYRVGTVFIVMLDPDRTDGTGENVVPIWSAGLNGLAASGSTQSRIENGINQAFAQSKYLGAGK